MAVRINKLFRADNCCQCISPPPNPFMTTNKYKSMPTATKKSGMDITRCELERNESIENEQKLTKIDFFLIEKNCLLHIKNLQNVLDALSDNITINNSRSNNNSSNDNKKFLIELSCCKFLKIFFPYFCSS